MISCMMSKTLHMLARSLPQSHKTLCLSSQQVTCFHDVQNPKCACFLTHIKSLFSQVNKSLVSLINRAGGCAVGMCGKDGKLITARSVGGGLGYVGEITAIDTAVLKGIIRHGHLPVIASVAADKEGQAYNINADIAAGEIAASLGAEKLILMTDVPGVMQDFKDINTLVREIDIKGVRKLIQDGVVSGGMIPKVECCVRSLAQGVHATHIIDGRAPHSLLLEILTDEGAGTMITG